jgi:exoribonuclease II
MTRSKALVTLVCIVMGLLVIGVGFDTAQLLNVTDHVSVNQLHMSVNQLHDTQALCAFRDDIQTRVTSGLNFLISHPKGIAGISAQTLRVGIVNEQHTLAALHPLVCPN